MRAALITTIAIGLLAGSATAVTAQDEPAAPVEFTGSIAFGPCTGPQTTEVVDGVTQLRGDGRYCRPGVVEPFSDPRLVGDYFVWSWRDRYPDGPTLFRGGFSIKNDEGTWQGIPNLGINDPDGSNSTRTSILVGTGAYEGLTAVAEISLDNQVWDWKGWIIDGEILPAPDPPAEAQAE